MHKIYRLYFTLKQLSYFQIAFRIIYIFKRKLIEQFGSFVYAHYEKNFNNTKLRLKNNLFFVLNDRSHYPYKIDDLLENKFTFLNHKIDFGTKIDWHKTELNNGTRLLKLNLNYHEFLIDIAYSFEKNNDKKYINYIEDTVSEWFEQNPIGTPGYGQDNWRTLKCFGFKGSSSSKSAQNKGHFNQFKALLYQQKNGGDPIIPFNDIINTTRVSFAAIESLKQSKWISIK
jgi:hypothetical protein